MNKCGHEEKWELWDQASMICSPCVAHKCVSAWEGGWWSYKENIWICFSWCAVVAATAQRGQRVGSIFSRCTASHLSASSQLPQIGTWTLPLSEPSAVLQQMEEKQAGFFLFFFLAPAHILRTVNTFSILVVSVERQFSENYEAFLEQKIQLFWGTVE